jgi:protein FrlC
LTEGDNGVSRITFAQVAGMNMHYVFYPFECFLDAVVRCGISRVEVWGGAPHAQVEELTPRRVTRLRREIELRGLEVVCFTPEQCVYPVNLAAAERGLRRRSVRYFAQAVRAAAELGTGKLLITSGWGYFNEPTDEAWKRSRESLSEVAEVAGENGVTLALEPLQRTESNLVTSLDSLGAMLGELCSPHARACLDTVAMAAAGDTIAAYFDRLGGDLVHVHLTEGDPTGHLAWGDGKLPLGDYLHELGERGYRGSLTLEIGDERYVRDPEAATRRAVETLRAFLD